jgi:ketosteroid isomerase-like protein
MSRRINFFGEVSMKRGTPLLPILRVLALAVFAVLAATGNGYAQQSEVNKVTAAIEALHAAIGARDFAKLEPLWAHDADVMLINPRDKSVSVGWDAVKKNWQSAFKLFPAKFKITPAEGPHIVVDGNVAWSTGIAGSTNVGPGVFETDVFAKRGGKWLLVSHTALRVPQ